MNTVNIFNHISLYTNYWNSRSAEFTKVTTVYILGGREITFTNFHYNAFIMSIVCCLHQPFKIYLLIVDVVTLEKIEGTVTNAQCRDTDKIGHKTQNETSKTKNATQKTKNASNTDPTKKRE